MGINNAPSLVSVGRIVPHLWCHWAQMLVSLGGVVPRRWCHWAELWPCIGVIMPHFWYWWMNIVPKGWIMASKGAHLAPGTSFCEHCFTRREGYTAWFILLIFFSPFLWWSQIIQIFICKCKPNTYFVWCSGKEPGKCHFFFFLHTTDAFNIVFNGKHLHWFWLSQMSPVKKH